MRVKIIIIYTIMLFINTNITDAFKTEIHFIKSIVIFQLIRY